MEIDRRMVSAEKRQVLWFCPANCESDLGFSCEATATYLRSAGWKVYLTGDIESAKRLLSKYDFHVGLATFGPAAANRTSYSLYELLRTTDAHVYWVGLVDEQLLKDAQVREIIARSLYDFHSLPPDPPRLLLSLGHALGMADIARSVLATTPMAENARAFIGNGNTMQEVFRDLARIARSDAPVMITGESGSGKELTARTIHQRSRRAQGPFVAVNCGALPGDLIQSELFGHEKGSFTGANQRHTGRIELANTGTLFLDEIGDLPLHLEVNLLRFLEERVIERVGGKHPIPVDVRIVCATHRDLKDAVGAGLFREDLYHRLNVLQLDLPPLRKRREDIKALAQHYLKKYAGEGAVRIDGFSDAAMEQMMKYAWPGNVRELINRVRRAVVMCDEHKITCASMGLETSKSALESMTLAETRAEADKRAIQQSLSSTGYNVSETARHLGVSRITLYRLMDKYAIRPNELA